VSSTRVRAGSGDAVQSEAVLDARPGLAEVRAAKNRRDLVQHLGEGEDFRRLIDQDDAACRVRGCVQPGQPGSHRMAHDKRALDA
jgi:hypothetical protein